MTVAEVIKKMVEYSQGDIHDINHFMKVYAYAKTIAEGENLSPEMQKLVFMRLQLKVFYLRALD